MPRRDLKTIERHLPSWALFIRRRRKALGYTQEQLATRVGISLSLLKRIEIGDINLQLNKLVGLLEFLGGELAVVESKAE